MATRTPGSRGLARGWAEGFVGVAVAAAEASRHPPTPALSPRQQPSLAGVLEIPGAHLRRFLGRAGLHFRGCSLKDGWGSSLAG